MIISSYKNYLRASENSFWNFINSKRVVNSEFNIMYKDNISYNGNENIANGFADYFKSVFNIPDRTVLQSSDSGWFQTLSIREFDISDMKYGFRKSSGPDLIPDFIIKFCEYSLQEPLRFIFNLSLKSCAFPEFWKCTKVTPIHKKGDKSYLCNYRPVAILSAPAKLFEIILHKYIYNHCWQFLVDQQHGFRPTRSTVTNLLTFTKVVNKSLDNNIQLDVIYTDFEKAFDKVNHDILINKLMKFGFSNNLTCFLRSYLRDRRQFVSYNSQRSKEYITCSGVPQGSNLGPLLFLLFINDINTAIVHSDYLLYADDLKIFKSIQSISDSLSLQKDLDSLWRWSLENGLPFSIGKCHFLSFSRKLDPLRFSYNLGGNSLNKEKKTMDLGILFSEKLDFSEHIINLSVRSSKMLGFVMRTANQFTNLLAIRSLYDTLVRSILEYGSIIWNPNTAKYSLILEKIQKKIPKIFVSERIWLLSFGIS